MACRPTPPSTPKQFHTTPALRPTTNVYLSATVIQPANRTVAARTHAGLRIPNVSMWPLHRRRWLRQRQKHRSILARPVQHHGWLISAMFMGFVLSVGLSLVWPLSCSEVGSNSNYEPVQLAHYLDFPWLSVGCEPVAVYIILCFSLHSGVALALSVFWCWLGLWSNRSLIYIFGIRVYSLE